MRRAVWIRAAAAAAALALAGCGGGGGGSGGGSGGSGGGAGGGGSSAGAPRSPSARVEVVEHQGKGRAFDPQAIYKAEAPGVVTVVSLFGGGGLEQVLGGGGGQEGGVGSGFVLDGKGEIATNAHVVVQGEGTAIKRAQQVYVEFADGNRIQADIVGYDPNADVALLQVDPKGLWLRTLPLGRSGDVQVGEPVAAIGSPFDERQSLSVGVVSAVDRSINSLTDFQIPGAVQTDAAINPGNSGGPLIDQQGRVIGINEQIKTNSGGGEGVGFAVPIDLVRRSLDQLRTSGKASYAYLGVESVPLYPQLVEHFKLDVGKGAWIQDVTPGGPAERAGLHGGAGTADFQASTYRQGGDVITKVGGHPIASADDLSSAVAAFRPGDTVTVEVHRGGAVKDVRVRLGERPLGRPSSPGG